MAVEYLRPLFDHRLKGAPDPHTPAVLTYATGINAWQTSPGWPLGTAMPPYLAADGTAGFAKPVTAGHDDYVSDPAKPVLFTPRPI